MIALLFAAALLCGTDLTTLLIPDMMGNKISFSEALEKTFTDEFLVVHRGEVVYEWGEVNRSHPLWSVSKGFLGVMAGVAVEEGKLDPQQHVSYYLPELTGTQYGDATIDQLLDMEVVVSDVPAQYSIEEFAPGIQKGETPGKVFFYTSVTSEVLGWVLERVTNQKIPNYLQEKIWSKIDAEGTPNYTLDRKGRAKVGGGLHASASDLARFAAALFEGKLVSKEWIQKTFWEGEGGAFQNSLYSLPFPSGNYEDHWWKFNGNEGPFLALGIYGQYVWIDPKKELIIVKLSTQPKPVDLASSFLNIMIFKAIDEVCP